MSFSFSPGLGPRGAISELGQAPAKEGRYYDRAVVTGMLAYLRPYKRQMVAGRCSCWWLPPDIGGAVLD